MVDLLAPSLVASSIDVDTYHEVMIHRCNTRWMARISAMLDQGRVLVLVGAAHSPGKDVLIAGLRERRYRVSPIWLRAGGTASGDR
ncbi:TraB/GumN family protein [Dyella japonica]|uniref:Uncharacterized protein YbaP (TraB family) n=1 Tax=Dyella japonica TaxID=231455 RepID=A0ABV2K2F2_9GAMM